MWQIAVHSDSYRQIKSKWNWSIFAGVEEREKRVHYGLVSVPVRWHSTVVAMINGFFHEWIVTKIVRQLSAKLNSTFKSSVDFAFAESSELRWSEKIIVCQTIYTDACQFIMLKWSHKFEWETWQKSVLHSFIREMSIFLRKFGRKPKQKTQMERKMC